LSRRLQSWRPFNGVSLSVTSKTAGVSKALPNSLQVQVSPRVFSGDVGFENTGFWGIKVQAGWTYNASFYVKSSSSFHSSITASLVSSTTGQVFASHVIPASSVSTSWKKVSFTLSPTVSAQDISNTFRITLNGADAKGATLFFGLFSLFPPTFLGRPNGMRIDLAQALAGTNPGVWRFPGGNNLEGLAWDQRWKWNETIGPLEDRPGRSADWGYPNTDGLGLVEYLNWAEDIGAVSDFFSSFFPF
jgi:alpha-L-arabinofuranosidase